MSLASRRVSYAVPLAVTLVALLAYCFVGIGLNIRCGPGRVAVVGFFGPECVCEGWGK